MIAYGVIGGSTSSGSRSVTIDHATECVLARVLAHASFFLAGRRADLGASSSR